jgi:hypothetical protein
MTDHPVHASLSTPVSASKEPSAEYGRFEEKGYAFCAKIPSSDADRCAFHIDVSRATNNQRLFSLEVAMVYPPRFGVDVGDSATLEQVTSLLIDWLPEAHEFGDADFERVADGFRSSDFSKDVNRLQRSLPSVG